MYKHCRIHDFVDSIVFSFEFRATFTQSRANLNIHCGGEEFVNNVFNKCEL